MSRFEYIGHPFTDWLLVHDYPHTQADGFEPKPLRSITALSEAAMAETIEYLQAYGFGGKFQQKGYIERRREVETWLRVQATRRCGLSDDIAQHPLYFEPMPSFRSLRAKDMGCVAIAADMLPEDKMTFTIGDSFHAYSKFVGMPTANNPPGTVPMVLKPSELHHMLVYDHVLPDYFRRTIDAPYIECQFWDPNHPLIDFARNAPFLWVPPNEC